MIKILQFAKVPPPIGGVTIHVQRLLNKIRTTDYLESDVLDYSKKQNLLKVCSKIFTSDIIHIHLSNKLIRLLFLLFCRVIAKKTAVTFHSMYDFSNLLDRLSLLICNYVIVLNTYSFENASKFRKNNVVQIGAFIPPIDVIALNPDLSSNLLTFTSRFDLICCVNASRFSLDEFGNDIYMGQDIFDFFSEQNNIGLIFSDPTGVYKQKFFNNHKNIFMITEEHDFINVIKMSDIFLRLTTTDGDSLSVKEALYYNKKTIATNCVERPDGVTLISKIEELKGHLNHSVPSFKKPTDNSLKIMRIYKKMMA